MLRSGKTYRLAIPPSADDDQSSGDLNITDPLTLKSSAKKLAAIDARGSIACS